MLLLLYNDFDCHGDYYSSKCGKPSPAVISMKEKI